jgi:L-glutamine---4-(methylsulfanyl)-2-oxobutanoate aminotransferase
MPELSKRVSFFREDINHLIRLHFAKKNDTLEEALNRLSNLKQKARGIFI